MTLDSRHSTLDYRHSTIDTRLSTLDNMLSELKDLYDEELMAAAEEKLPEGFDQRLSEMIAQLEAKEHKKVVTIGRKPSAGYPQIGFFRKYAAACVAMTLIIGGGFALSYAGWKQTQFTDTCKTTQEAEMQMNRAFELIAQNTRKGLDGARNQIERAQQNPTKNFEQYINFSN